MLLCFLIIAVALLCLQGEPTGDVAGGLEFFLVVALAFVLLDRRSAWALSMVCAIAFSAVHVSWLGNHLAEPIDREPTSEAGFSIVVWLAVGGIISAVMCSTTGALRKHRAHVEELVSERTGELREVQQRLMGQEKLAVLGQLAGGVGHELRNPLGAIKKAAFFLDMALTERECDPEVQETLAILEQEEAGSERIVSSLLNFARPWATDRRRVDANELMGEVLSGTGVPLSINVEAKLADQVPTVLADTDQMALVLGTILRNAVPAMPQGGRLKVVSEKYTASGEAEAEARLIAQDMVTGDWIVIRVSDTGVGIPQENLERIFEPLFTTRAKGIGLGLPIVRTLVEGQGGHRRGGERRWCGQHVHRSAAS